MRPAFEKAMPTQASLFKTTVKDTMLLAIPQDIVMSLSANEATAGRGFLAGGTVEGAAIEAECF